LTRATPFGQSSTKDSRMRRFILESFSKKILP
jgi:hypothetical protein